MFDAYLNNLIALEHERHEANRDVNHDDSFDSLDEMDLLDKDAENFVF